MISKSVYFYLRCSLIIWIFLSSSNFFTCFICWNSTTIKYWSHITSIGEIKVSVGSLAFFLVDLNLNAPLGLVFACCRRFWAMIAVTIYKFILFIRWIKVGSCPITLFHLSRAVTFFATIVFDFLFVFSIVRLRILWSCFLSFWCFFIRHFKSWIVRFIFHIAYCCCLCWMI